MKKAICKLEVDFQLEGTYVVVYVNKKGEIFKLSYKDITEVYFFDPVEVYPDGRDNKSFYEEIRDIAVDMKIYDKNAYERLYDACNDFFKSIVGTCAFTNKEYQFDGEDITRTLYVDGKGDLVKFVKVIDSPKKEDIITNILYPNDPNFKESVSLFLKRCYYYNDEYKDLIEHLNSYVIEKYFYIKYIPIGIET